MRALFQRGYVAALRAACETRRAVSSRTRADARSSRWTYYAAHGAWLGAVGSLLVYVWRRGRRKVASGNERGGDGGRRRFVGKVVLITGAAGDIGSATASAFAVEGATVVMVDLPHTQHVLEARCSELEEVGAEKALLFTADMTKEEEVQGMVDYTVQRAGAIHCFFNNAGIQGELSPIQAQQPDLFKRVMEVNVLGAFYGLKFVSAAMVESGGGVIVNTASLAGMLGPPNMAAYAASKHAVIGLTKTAAKDLARHGIRVCAVSPGLLEGKMWHSQVEGQAKCFNQAHTPGHTGEDKEVTDEELKETEQRMLAGTPMVRLGRLSEVASAVLFLCSDDASYLTGTILPVDGGRLP